MRFLASALFAFSAPAIAATPIDKMKGSIGSVSMGTDRVDVPLFSAPSGYPFPSVQVTIGERQYLFKVASSLTSLYVSPRVVKDHDLKVREGNKKAINLKGEANKFKLGGEQKYAELDELQIGFMVLNDVVVSTKKTPMSSVEDWQAPATDGKFYDGVIGLGALPAEISWAIRPSDGQVSFARGEAVAGLSSGGTTVPFSQNDSYKYQYGTRKGISDAYSMIVDANIGGTLRSTLLSTASVGGFYFTEEPTPASINGRYADVDTRHHPIALARTPMGSTWMLEATALPEMPLPAQAVVGVKVLHRFDITADRTNSTVTLDAVERSRWNDPRDFLLAQALKDVEPKPEENEGDESNQDESGATEETEENPKPPGDAAKWLAVKDLYLVSGDIDKSIEAMGNVLAFDDKKCSSYITLGKLQLRAGDIQAAKSSFETASTTYHAWFDRSLDDREALKKEYDKLDQEEKDASEFYPAEADCFVADGLLAEAVFAAGDLEGVESLYRERFDLDEGLALLAGNALISKGEYARAQEPLRQSLKAPGRHRLARFALAMSYAGSGDWTQASALFERSLDYAHPSQAVKVWIDAYTAAEGLDAARSAARAYAAKKPEMLASQFGLAYALRDSEDSTERQSVQNAGEIAFQKALMETPRDGYVWAEYARWLNLWGEIDKAETAAQKSLSTDLGTRGVATALIALSEIYAAKDNDTLATQYEMKAVQAAPRHPGYAPLMHASAQ